MVQSEPSDMAGSEEKAWPGKGMNWPGYEKTGLGKMNWLENYRETGLALLTMMILASKPCNHGKTFKHTRLKER